MFARAAELDKAVEIDAYSDRQDLDVELLQVAKEEGVRISFGSDSHHPWQLCFWTLRSARPSWQEFGRIGSSTSCRWMNCSSG